jgi:hypothetical protein
MEEGRVSISNAHFTVLYRNLNNSPKNNLCVLALELELCVRYSSNLKLLFTMFVW